MLIPAQGIKPTQPSIISLLYCSHFALFTLSHIAINSFSLLLLSFCVIYALSQSSKSLLVVSSCRNVSFCSPIRLLPHLHFLSGDPLTSLAYYKTFNFLHFCIFIYFAAFHSLLEFSSGWGSSKSLALLFVVVISVANFSEAKYLLFLYHCWVKKKVI